MTKKEVSELFSVIMTAWPHAEMCKATEDDLNRMITLWKTCLNDIDFWIAQQALLRLCQKLKFAPTIADLRSEAEEVGKGVESSARLQWDMFYLLGKEEFMQTFNSPLHAGVVKALTVADGDWYKFRDSYFEIVKRNSALLQSKTTNQRRLT